MSRTISSSIILLALGTLCLFTSSHCPTFYTQPDQQGDSFQLCSSGDVPSGYNDQAISFEVPHGYSVMLYVDSGYSGQSYGPYIEGAHNLPNGLILQLSSVSIALDPGLDGSNLGCVVFYTDSNMQGTAFRLCSSGNVPGLYDDQTSSFVVPPGYSVVLHADLDFNGESFGPYIKGSYNNMPSGYSSFNDQLSSVTITPPSNSSCVTFYTDYNQQGTAFQVCEYMFQVDVPFPFNNVPDLYNDKASSFVVPAGYFVMLYSNELPGSTIEGEGAGSPLEPADIGGFYIGPYLPGKYNMPTNFNDQLSSVTFNDIEEFNCAIFFSDYSQQNTAFQLCRSGDISVQNSKSFIVPNWYTVTLYTGSNYTGQSYGPYLNGSYNVPHNSSYSPTFARILPMSTLTGPPAVLDPKCATFYNELNQQNYLFQQCADSNVNVDYMLSNQISSFIVPKGYTVILYTDIDFEGQASDSYSEGSYSVPSPFRDNLNSIKVDPVYR